MSDHSKCLIILSQQSFLVNGAELGLDLGWTGAGLELDWSLTGAGVELEWTWAGLDLNRTEEE